MGLIRASAFLYFCNTECKLPPGAHSNTKHNGLSNTPAVDKYIMYTYGMYEESICHTGKYQCTYAHLHMYTLTNMHIHLLYTYIHLHTYTLMYIIMYTLTYIYTHST